MSPRAPVPGIPARAPFCLALLLAVTAVAGALPGARAQERPNLLIVIADDYGVGDQALYGIGPAAPPTPHIDALYEAGVLFENAWANPLCSPTRATMMTGRYGFRTGVGTAIAAGSPELALSETTIPEALAAAGAGYATAAIGKWHLSTGATDPNTQGFDLFAGSIDGAVDDYGAWDKTVNGVTTEDYPVYATTDNVDDALAFVGAQDGPWLVWLAFNAPHTPHHLPPADLHGYDGLSGRRFDLFRTPRPYFEAMVEAMDTELGRLLDAVDLDETTVVFVGDNGTFGRVVEAPFEADRAKSTLYEGGVRVPLLVAGAGVEAPRRRVTDPVHTVDLFATVLDLAGASEAGARGVDAVSLRPYLEGANAGGPRQWTFAEVFGDPQFEGIATGETTRGLRYKLVRPYGSGAEELYDLAADPFETQDLLAGPLDDDAAQAYATLAARLDTLGTDDAAQAPDALARADASGALTVSPNPARDRARVRFALAEAAPIRLDVYDALGRRVAVLADDAYASGAHDVLLDAATLGLRSGVYVCRLTAGDGVRAARLVLVR